MNAELYEKLKKITPEEQKILDGAVGIDREIYVSADLNDRQYIIEAKRLLEEGKLIQVRKHTRFVYFPKHTHDFVEMVYMYSGKLRQIINNQTIVLQQGELLILNQNSVQEIFPAGKDDIAINFIVLPEFFDFSLRMMENEQNTLRQFMIDCIRGASGTTGYMHFKVADVLPVQNLMENLIWTIQNRVPNRRSINQATMGLLFLQLMNYMDKVETDAGSDQQLVLSVLRYVEEHYKEGTLTELADRMHYDFAWLSREIKKQTGMTYTELVQEKRLQQAAYLLKTTAMSVLEVGMAVGYDNQSYFHRIFQKKYGLTPKKYRVQVQGGKLTS